MTQITIQWSAHRYYGSAKPWVALVHGSDEQYGYARTFMDSAEERSRSGATGDVTWNITEPGLYECRYPRRQHDDGGWRIVFRAKDGSLKWTECDAIRRDAVVALMDAGSSFEQARSETRTAKKTGSAA